MRIQGDDIVKEGKFFENILKSINDLIVVVDPDATIRFVNQTFMDLVERPFDEIIGIPVGRVFTDDAFQFFNLIKELVRHGEVRNKSLYILNKNRERIPVNLNGAIVRDEGDKIVGMVFVARDMRDIQRLIDELERINEELEDRVKKRTEELRNAKGSIEEAYKKLQQTQTQLIQSEKMASIGQLAAGIAHEINNPAGFVSSNLKTLEDYISDLKSLLDAYDYLEKVCKKIEDNRIKEAIEKVEREKDDVDLSFLLTDIDQIIQESQEGMKRIARIVKDLREFSHAGSDKPEYADINRCLESTLNIVWNELKYKAEVETILGDIPGVLCYPQQLNQVFMNILVNAVQAIKERGKITVKTFAENEHVIVEISDTGDGIPPESLSRIFEPFFTTKPVGKGTGLGLSVAYAIIQKHGGHISVRSEMGKGTCFTVSIPVEYEKLKTMEDK